MMKIEKYRQPIKKTIKKGKPSKMQVAFTNAMKEHNTYMQESDKKFLSEMREHAERGN